MSIVSANFLLNHFLYSQDFTPIDIADGGLIRGLEERGRIEVDTQSYMNAIGRFAPASKFELIQLFFSVVSELPPKLDSNGDVTFRTKND